MSGELSFEKEMVRLEARLNKLESAQLDMATVTFKKLQLEIEGLAAKVAELERASGYMDDKLLVHDDLLERLRLKARLSLVGRRAKTYETWALVRDKLRKGVSIKQVAIELGLPYSTCWSYSRTSPEEAKRVYPKVGELGDEQPERRGARESYPILQPDEDDEDEDEFLDEDEE